MEPFPKQDSTHSVEACSAIILSGRASILPHAPLLEQVAEEFGQPAAMGWLEFFLSGPQSRSKAPILVILVLPGTQAGALHRDVFVGCALFSEYLLLGLRTGAVSTEDTSGFRTVLAPAAHRGSVAQRCAAKLLDWKAHIVLASVSAGQNGLARTLSTHHRAEWTARTREVGWYLELQPNLVDTLAQFERNVRFRLGYFRRRLLRTTPCTFVPDVATELNEGQFLALNRGCLNVVPDEEARERWRACQRPGGYVVGVRTDDGQWLGMIGGWRQGSITVLHWQQNSVGWEKHSLTTVLRSYFLEHETERGTRRIVFYGGTPHSLRRYFPLETITDLLLCRKSTRAYLVRSILKFLRPRLQRPNFLADALSDTGLRWQKTHSAAMATPPTAPCPPPAFADHG